MFIVIPTNPFFGRELVHTSFLVDGTDDFQRPIRREFVAPSQPRLSFVEGGFIAPFAIRNPSKLIEAYRFVSKFTRCIKMINFVIFPSVPESESGENAPLARSRS